MGDPTGAVPAKKVKATKAKKQTAAPTHPKVSEMVNSAISTLKEKGGSSLQAIKKYVTATYKVDAEKLSPFIKKYLKSSVVNGSLVQTKGTGATGSFRIASAAATAKKPKTAAKPKKSASKSPKPKKATKSVPPKKAAAAKPKKSPAKKAKSPVKKAAAKTSPAKKPKSVKAATKTKKPKATPKKATAKKAKK